MPSPPVSHQKMEDQHLAVEGNQMTHHDWKMFCQTMDQNGWSPTCQMYLVYLALGLRGYFGKPRLLGTAMGKTLCTSCLDGSSFTPSRHISWCRMSLGTELVFALALLLHLAWVAEKLWEPYLLGFCNYSQSTESTGGIDCPPNKSNTSTFHPCNHSPMSCWRYGHRWSTAHLAKLAPEISEGSWYFQCSAWVLLWICKTYEKLSKLHTPFRWIWRKKGFFKHLIKTRAAYS